MLLSKCNLFYRRINSNTKVAVNARLVDVGTGQEIWEGSKRLVVSSSDQANGDIIAMLIVAIFAQVVNTSVDDAHRVSGMLNAQLIPEPGQGLLYGPRHELFGTDGL